MAGGDGALAEGKVEDAGQDLSQLVGACSDVRKFLYQLAVIFHIKHPKTWGEKLMVA